MKKLKFKNLLIKNQKKKNKNYWHIHYQVTTIKDKI
jgi:hypothetical protein